MNKKVHGWMTGALLIWLFCCVFLNVFEMRHNYFSHVPEWIRVLTVFFLLTPAVISVVLLGASDNDFAPSRLLSQANGKYKILFAIRNWQITDIPAQRYFYVIQETVGDRWLIVFHNEEIKGDVIEIKPRERSAKQVCVTEE